jgi:uncharacterized membrane protein
MNHPVPADRPTRTLAHLVYACYAASFLMLIPLFVGIVLAHLKQGEAAGDPLLASHFRWQIRTFWYGLLWEVIGGVLSYLLVGIPILFAATIWFIYRIVRGWLALHGGQAMYAQQ